MVVLKLYHGSSCIVEKPVVDRSRPLLDFGRGFYMTSYLEQAKQWAVHKSRVNKTRTAYINEYDLNEAKLATYNVLHFYEDTDQWIELVCDYRTGSTVNHNHDVIIGPVADDIVYNAAGMYKDKIWTLEQTREALRYKGTNDQWCFVSQRALDDSISFVRSWEVMS